MSQPDYYQMVKNYLDDITTALRYHEYVRTHIGKYIIFKGEKDKKPRILYNIRFGHRPALYSNEYVIFCSFELQDPIDVTLSENRVLEMALDTTLVVDTMDKPEFLIDLIVSNMSQNVDFIAKNKTTDLLFKNES